MSLWVVNGACWNLLVVVGVGVGVALARVLEVLWLDEGDVEDQADANESWCYPCRVKSVVDVKPERRETRNPANVSNEDCRIDVCPSLAVLGVLGR